MGSNNHYSDTTIMLILIAVSLMGGFVGYSMANNLNDREICRKAGFTYSDELNKCVQIVEVLR